MKTKTSQLFILAIISIWIICILSGCESTKYQTSLEYHQKLQKENSYETWKATQKKREIKAQKEINKINAERLSIKREEVRFNSKMAKLKYRDDD